MALSIFKKKIRPTGAEIIIIVPPTGHITVPPHLGSGYLASMARKNNFSVSILHCDKYRLGLKDIINQVKQIKPKVICLSIVTVSYSVCKKIISALRCTGVEAPIIVGGPHITSLGEYSIRDLNADYAVAGEGEVTFAEILNFLLNGVGQLNKIRGLLYKEDGNIHINQPRGLIQDLDTIPFPAWDIIRPASYPPLPHQILFKNFPVAPIITTRGCQHRCYFCAVPGIWGSGVRKRSPNNIVDEIQLLIDNYGIKEINIEDDSFTFDKDHAINLCKEIIKRKLNFSWGLPNGIRVDTVSEDLVSIMKEAGCYQIGLGIECADSNVLGAANKRMNLSTIQGAVEIIKRNKIKVRGFYMIGFPNESSQQIEETISLSKKLNTDFAVFGICSPLPGSSYFSEYFRNTSYEKISWKKITYYTGYYSKYLTPPQMKKLLRKCIFSYFTVPRNFFVFLRHTKFKQLYYVIKGFLRYSFA